MTATSLINSIYAHILFDSDATHSFENLEFANKLASIPDEMDIQLHVINPLGSVYRTDVIFKNSIINVKGKILSADLVQLEM